MALLIYQNFQTFPDADPGPWGALTSLGGSLISDTAAPDGSVGPYGETVYLDGRCQYDVGSSLLTMCALFAFRAPGLPLTGNLIEFNDSSAVFGSEVLFGLQMLPDSTLVPIFEASAIFTACDFIFSTNNWNYFQINLTISDGAGGSLHLVWVIVCDGKTISSGSADTRSVGPLRCDRIRFGGSVPGISSSHFGEVSVYDALQAVPFYPHPGTSLLRSTNEVIELIMVPGVPPPLSGTCPTPGTGVVGIAFSEFVQGVDGVPPYTYALADATTLPPGLTLVGATGQVHGTPTLAGTYSTHYSITDNVGTIVKINCSITITEIGGVCPTDVAVLGTTYSHSVTPVGGTGPYTYALVDATTLPPGLTLNASTGLISGTPLVLGSYNYHILITDSLGATTKAICTIVVGSPAPPGRFCVGQA